MPKTRPGTKPPATLDEIQLTIQLTPDGIRAAFARLAQLHQQVQRKSSSQQQAAPHRPIEVIAEELGAEVPEEAWAQVPEDFNEQFDHYVYGLPHR